MSDDAVVADEAGYEHRHGAHDPVDAGRKALALALAINTGFLVVELAGALIADSLALLADAVHMLTDSASLGLALFAAWVALRPADAKRTYGYHRAEVIGALVNGLLLIGAVGYVLFDAYRRFQDTHHVHAWALDSRRTALSAHLVVADGVDRDAVLGRCRLELADRFGIDHATIQIESEAFVETVEMVCYPATSD